MGKPKKYIGETWSNPFDHGGKDYRWDHKKKEYVVSHGESPVASITRALKEKFPDPLKHLDDARDERDNKWAEGLEGIGDALSSSDEAENPLTSLGTIIEGLASIKRTNDNRKKAEEPTETKSGDNVAEKDHEFYSKITGDFYNFDETDAGLKRNYYLEQLDPKDPKQALLQHNGAVNLTNAGIGEEQTSYQKMRKTAGERQKRRMEDKLAEGNPLKQFELDKQRGVGTPVNELFKKPEDVNNVEQDKQIETKIEKDDKKIENTNKIIDEGAKLTDSVKDIDGQIGDFVDPDKLKFKSLLGNFIGRNA